MTAISTNNAAFDQAMFMAKTQGLQKKTSIDTSNKKRIEETAKDFEAVFLSEMMSHMFKGVETNEVFGGGRGEEMFRSMMVRQYGKEIAAKGGIGIAKHVSEQMIRLQETQN